MFNKITVAALATTLTLSTSISYAGPKAEVLHWWTSGGEAKSVAVLQKEFSENGGSWTDMPVAGGGGGLDRHLSDPCGHRKDDLHGAAPALPQRLRRHGNRGDAREVQ